MAVPSTPTGVVVTHLLQAITKQRISWFANSAGEGVTTYNIYRAATPYITPELIGGTSGLFFDDTPPFNFQLNWFYFISAVNGSGEGIKSSGFSLEDFEFTPKTFTDATLRVFDQTNFQSEYFSDEDTDFEIREIRERLRNLCEMGGEQVWLFKREWSNAEGIEEEPGRREPTKYWTPLKITIKFEPTNWTRVLEIEGLRNIFTPRTWSIYYPLLADKDIILTRQGKKYEIMEIDYRRFRGFLLRQEFSTTELTSFDLNPELVPPGTL